jgi:hypothetical protein
MAGHFFIDTGRQFSYPVGMDIDQIKERIGVKPFFSGNSRRPSLIMLLASRRLVHSRSSVLS